MKPLPKDQLYRVKPKFRAMVLKAWANGEEVPESVTLLGESLSPSQMGMGVEIEKLMFVHGQPKDNNEQ